MLSDELAPSQATDLHLYSLAEKVSQFAARHSTWFVSRHVEELLTGLSIVVRQCEIFGAVERITTDALVQLRAHVWRDALLDPFGAPGRVSTSGWILNWTRLTSGVSCPILAVGSDTYLDPLVRRL